MFLQSERLNKSFDGKPVLRDVSFTVSDGEIISLIGPSGVGKTTLLKIIAGLDTADSGDLTFGVEPSKDNPVILVFQDYLLFPNLTVFDNVAFGLKARRMDKQFMGKRVMEILDYFQLADKHDAYPNRLSAGQRQRVAIARAMVVNPAMLLLDEPFANLDRNLKLHTAEFIRDTQKEFGVTTIAVTHDQEEAFLMSDRVGVMLDGRLAQMAPAKEVYDNPATVDVARFLGPINEIPEDLATYLGIQRKEDGYYVRPEQLHITPATDGNAMVREAVFVGHSMKYTLDIQGSSLVVFSTDGNVSKGDTVNLSFNIREGGF